MTVFKRCSLLLAGVFLCFCFSLMEQRVCFGNGENITFYCGNSSSNCRIVEAGETPIVTKITLNDICGESAEYKDFNLEEFLREVNGEILFCEELSDSVNYYCKADLPYSINLYGKEINLHICLREDGAKVASPIIFGGY